MNKRILSMALVLLMCLLALSFPALATDNTATVSANYSRRAAEGNRKHRTFRFQRFCIHFELCERRF